MISRIETNIQNMIMERRSRISHAFNVIEHEIKDKINQTLALVNRFETEMRMFNKQLKQKEQVINSNIKQLLIHTQNTIYSEKKHLEFLTRTLKNMDHRRLLERGYSITTTAEGDVLKSTSDAMKDSDIETILSDGKIVSAVKKTIK